MSERAHINMYPYEKYYKIAISHFEASNSSPIKLH